MSGLQLETKNLSASNVTCSSAHYFINSFEQQVDKRQRVLSAAFGCICVVGLIANVTLLTSLLRGYRRNAMFRAPSIILIINLAIADTLLLLTMPFAIVHRLKRYWPFGSTFCKLEESIKFLSYYSSVFFITAMAVDRFCTICHPVTYNLRKARKNLWFASTFLWFLSLAVSIPLVVFADVDEYGLCSIIFPENRKPSDFAIIDLDDVEYQHVLSCVEYYAYFEPEEYYNVDLTQLATEQYAQLPTSTNDYLDWIEQEMSFCSHPPIKSLHVWLVCNFVIGFLVPFGIISVCYFKIMILKSTIVSSQSQSKNDSEDFAPSSEEEKSRSIDDITVACKRRKYNSNRAKLVMGVLIPCLVLAFAACWLPYHAWHLAQISGIHGISLDTCNRIRDLTYCLAFFNSALNPILNSFFLFDIKERVQHFALWVKRLAGYGKNSNVKTEENSTTSIPGIYHIVSQRSLSNGDTVFATTTLVS